MIKCTEIFSSFITEVRIFIWYNPGGVEHIASRFWVKTKCGAIILLDITITKGTRINVLKRGWASS